LWKYGASTAPEKYQEHVFNQLCFLREEQVFFALTDAKLFFSFSDASSICFGRMGFSQHKFIHKTSCFNSKKRNRNFGEGNFAGKSFACFQKIL
jgi:hypothetical protein